MQTERMTADEILALYEEQAADYWGLLAIYPYWY